MKKISPPITSVVAATDFSAAGERAALRGALVAEQLGAELHLLHVVHPLDLYPELLLSFPSQADEYERLQQASGREKLDTLAATLRKDFSIQVQTAMRVGLAYVQIAGYAKHHAAGVVVAGSRGESTWLDLLLGSTVSRLLRVATCPILITRNAAVAPYQQAIAAVDFTSGSAAVLALANTLAPDASIELLHIFNLVQEARMRKVGLDDARLQNYRNDALTHVETQLDEMLAELGEERITRKVLTGYPPEEICTHAAKLHADLIVLGRQGRSGVQEFMLGSVSKDVVGRADCDVLLTNS